MWWRHRAEEARVQASVIKDETARATMEQMALDYDRIADRFVSDNWIDSM